MSLWACLFRSASTTSQTRRPYLRVHCPIFGLFVTTFSAHSLSSMVSALLSSWRDVITTSISGNWNSERSPPPPPLFASQTHISVGLTYSDAVLEQKSATGYRKSRGGNPHVEHLLLCGRTMLVSSREPPIAHVIPFRRRRCNTNSNSPVLPVVRSS